MADSWEDLVTPVSRGQNAMADAGNWQTEVRRGDTRTVDQLIHDDRMDDAAWRYEAAQDIYNASGRAPYVPGPRQSTNVEDRRSERFTPLPFNWDEYRARQDAYFKSLDTLPPGDPERKRLGDEFHEYSLRRPAGNGLFEMPQNAMANDGVSPYENAMAQARTMVRAPSPLGYEYSRAQFDRRVNEGLSGRDAVEALTLGLTALAPGRPRPNPVGPPAAEVFDMPGMRNASRVNAIEDTNPAGWPRSLHYPANAQHAPKLDVIPGGKTKGGAGPTGGMTFDDVRGMLERLGVPIDRVTTAGTGTRYVRVRDDNGAVVTIRIPGDTHVGNPQKAGPPGEFFDTASQKLSPSQERYRSGTVTNEGGERFANPEALEAAMRWRFPNYVSRTGENFLVRPDQAPRIRPNTETPAPAREGADFSPDQPRLLSVAAPAAAGWAATVTPESEMAPRENEAQSNAGRFAAPLVSPDAQLATDTRLLNDRVSAATRNIEADFDFSDLVTPVTPHARRGMREAFNAMAGS